MRQENLLTELNYVKWEAAQESVAGGLFGMVGAAPAANAPTSTRASTRAVEESAARAGQFGATTRPENAALTAQRPGDAIPSVERAGEIMRELLRIDEEIGTARRRYGVETIGPPRSRPQYLNRQQIDQIMTAIAKAAAQTVEDPAADAAALLNLELVPPKCKDYARFVNTQRNEIAKSSE